MNPTRKIQTALLSLAVLFTSSCLKDEDNRTQADEIKELNAYLAENNIIKLPTWTGLYFLEDSVGTGSYPVLGDTLLINFRGTLIDGTLLASSEVNGEPAKLVLWDWSSGIIPGLYEALSYMKTGGKASAIIPSVLAFGAYSTGLIEPYSTLLYDLELLEIMPGIPVEPYTTTGLTLNTTSSGLQYYKVVENERVMVRSGNQVSVKYTGYLPDGRIFDSSVKRGKNATFTVGIGDLIPGFDEGLLLMKEGEQFRLVIPYSLAYGDRGSFPIIQPYTNLTFDVEVVDILY